MAGLFYKRDEVKKKVPGLSLMLRQREKAVAKCNMFKDRLTCYLFGNFSKTGNSLLKIREYH